MAWRYKAKLNLPHDVSIDSNDIVYVCDTYNHQIYIFDTSSTLFHSFGSKGTAPGQFDSAFGVAVDMYSQIYVSDNYTNCTNCTLATIDGKHIKGSPFTVTV